VSHLENGCDLILLSGGMSVDPDDVTRLAIRQAGATEMHYGASALPGAMFLSAWIGNVPLLGVPACGLYHRTTVLDLVLPRILAGERIGKKELAFFGHGGLCQDCPDCVFPELRLRQRVLSRYGGQYASDRLARTQNRLQAARAECLPSEVDPGPARRKKSGVFWLNARRA